MSGWLIDTSAIYAALDSTDSNHAAASRWLDQHCDGRLVTHAAVIAEATGLLDRRLGIDASRMFVDELLPTIAVFVGSELTYERALASYRIGSGRRRPSLVDCFAFETMRELHVTTAFAFDDHFVRAGFQVVPDA